MRSIGRFKDSDIYVDAIHVQDTYGGFGFLIGKAEDRNFKIVNYLVGEKAIMLFGSSLPYHICGHNEIDYNKRLPDEVVWAHLSSGAPIGKGHGSQLVIAWFQEEGKDPFGEAVVRLKSINWEKAAEDFEY